MDPASGGPCQGIRNSIPELEKIGVHNEVVCLDDPGLDYIGKDVFTIHAIGPSKGGWQSSPHLIPWLLGNLHRFDVVIIHGLWLYHGFAVRKAFEAYKRKNALNVSASVPKLYMVPHGMLDPYFQKAKGRKIKAFRNWLYWKLIESKIVNNVEGILFTCEAELLLARETFRPYKPKNEINVGYGIAAPPAFKNSFIQAFKEKCIGLNDGGYLLFLSRIHEKKGVDLLIEAYASWLESIRNNGTENSKKFSGNVLPKLVIAGPGLESVYGQKLCRIVSENEVLKRSVFFPGMLSGNAKWGAFYGCDTFILPSHQENFGIAVAEALACGKPVLISNQVNIWKEIESGGAGIVEPDTLEGTKNLMERFFSLGASAQKEMGAKSIACYQNNFTIRVAAKKLYEAVKN